VNAARRPLCWWFLAASLALTPHFARAQSNTDETLRRSIRLYEDLQVERALAMFREVISPSTPFVGTANYRQMLHDPIVAQAIQHTLVYTVLFVPGTMVVGLFLAVAMNRKIRFISFYRTAAYATMAISTISEAIVFIWLFDPSYGIVNYFFSLIGLPQQQFLNSPSEALYVIVVMTIWGWTGFSVVVYLAAL